MKSTDCEKKQALYLKENSLLSQEERHFLKNHKKNCDDCSFTDDIFKMISNKEEPFVQPLDELSQRRWNQDILIKYNNTNQVKTKTKGARLLIITAAATLLMGFISGLIFSSDLLNKKQDLAIESLPISDIKENQEIKILTSGQSSLLSNKEKTNLFQKEISTNENPMALSMGNNIALLLEPQTKIKIEANNSFETIIRLIKGTLFANKIPFATATNHFEIITTRANFEVKGTIFEVTHNSDVTRLRVLKGNVEIIEKNTQNIHKGTSLQKASYPKWEQHSLSQNDQNLLINKMKTMDLFEKQNEGNLEISSTPKGALVFIDNQYIGKTPLVSSIRQGHRMLNIKKENFQTVTEHLNIAPESKQSRLFSLETLSAPLLVKNEQEDQEKASTDTQVKPRATQTQAASANELKNMMDKVAGHRLRQDWQAAALEYKKIIARYPNTPQAHTALVSLGLLELNHLNQPSIALNRFNLYLRKGGPLSQEALFAKATAYKILSNKNSEIKTLEEFLRRYPGAVEAPKAKARLKTLK